MGCKTDEICDSEEKNTSGELDEPKNGIGSRGVKLSDVMVTGRQKLEVSELKWPKASWSSWETRKRR